jgi:hypothetical protein
MNPMMKYTLGRVGLFVILAVVLLVLPIPLDFFLRLLIALVVSMALQFVVLRKWRAEMIDYVDGAMSRRRDEKAKLRAALSGDDVQDEDSDQAQPSR